MITLESINSKQYVEWKVKPVMSIDGKYGFRIVLTMSDGQEKMQQRGGFKTKSDANKERNNVITDLTNGTYIVENKVKVKDYIKMWLDEVMRPKITNDSYVTYSNSINKYIIPCIGNFYLTSVNRGHISKLYKMILEKSPAGVRIAKTILKNAFNFAIRKKIMQTNPVINVKYPKELAEKKFRTTNIDSSKTLTLEQANLLVCKSEGTRIHMQIIFAVFMGLRKGEINGLKYTDIDYIRRKIKINRQLGIKPNTLKKDFKAKTYTKQEIKLKTPSSYRELDIPDYVFEEILKEREIYEKNKKRRINDKTNPFQDLNYICCSSYGRPRSKAYVYLHYKALLRENNLPDIRWHDLRKTLATLLLKNNYSPKAVSKILGHSKEIITVDVYGDNQQLVDDCLEELEPFIAEVIPARNHNELCDDPFIVDKIEQYILELNLPTRIFTR